MLPELNEFSSGRPECKYLFDLVSGIIKVNRNVKTAPLIYKPYLLNYTPSLSINYSGQKNK